MSEAIHDVSAAPVFSTPSRTVAAIAAFLVVEAALLWVVGWQHVRDVNPDAVAYIRIAQYYVDRNFDLAVSGYWGPLLSWLICPFIAAGFAPLVAARLAMGFSALIFVIGCLAVYRTTIRDRRDFWLFSLITGLFAVSWSVDGITPDLLMSGLFLCGLGVLWSAGSDLRLFFLAGLFMGLAYLAKSVALPTAALVLVIVFARRLAADRQLSFHTKNALAVCLGIALVAGPWISVLTVHYGRPTFSTSAPINHAMVGQQASNHHYFVRAYHSVPPGRATIWEDPDPSNYELWSPFDSAARAKEQARVVADNLVAVTGVLKSFDRFGLLFAAVVLACVWPLRRASWPPWREGAIIVIGMAVIYLPVFAGAARYFLATVPLMLGAAYALFAEPAPPDVFKRPQTFRRLMVAVILLSFVSSFGAYFARALAAPASSPLDFAEQATKLLAGHPRGPLLSVGSDDSASFQAMYYAAMLLSWQYGGSNIDPPTIEALRQHRGSYLAVAAGEALDRELKDTPAIQWLGTLSRGSTSLSLYALR